MKGNHVIVLDKLNATRTQKKVTDGLVYHRTKHHPFICLSCNLFQLTEHLRMWCLPDLKRNSGQNSSQHGNILYHGKRMSLGSKPEPDPRNGTMSHSQLWGPWTSTVLFQVTNILSLFLYTIFPQQNWRLLPYQILELIKSPQSVQRSLKADSRELQISSRIQKPSANKYALERHTIKKLYFFQLLIKIAVWKTKL